MEAKRLKELINLLNSISSKDLVRCSDLQLKTLQNVLNCKSVEVSKVLNQRTHYRTHFNSTKSEKTK